MSKLDIENTKYSTVPGIYKMRNDRGNYVIEIKINSSLYNNLLEF